ncbi:MAG: LytTR family transcriptional regulator, partial [Pseudomonadales bacterium]|nr:LytTR family transcriptional regulator [Pseudomonadales bacterium]
EVKDIEWVDAAGDYMCVHAKGETHVMRITMKDLEQQLDPTVFQRVHRSTIVNLDRVVKVSSHMNGEYFLVLSNGNSVKMSRSYKDKVKHFF